MRYNFRPQAISDVERRQVPVAQEKPEVRAAFMRKVYTNLVWSMLIMLSGMYYALHTPTLLRNVLTHPILFIILFFGLFFWAQAVRLKPGINIIALLVFAFVNGIFLAPTIAFYIARQGGMQIVFNAFSTTAVIFVGLTAYTLISKKDFSFLGGFLISGVIALIIAMLVTSIFRMNVSDFPIAVIGALLFSGLILYDTSRIMRYLPANEYISATLSLYLDFVNLFLFILRIFGGRRD